MTRPPRQILEETARTAYGRLLAVLAARTRDIPSAEDALSEALVAALRRWPDEGVPQRPEAWLLTVARRRLTDRHRHLRVVAETAADVQALWERHLSAGSGPFADRRLELLFVCAHPAIDPPVRAPLMLQTVLGLSAEVVAGAFLVAPKTMGQRLWRAKRRIAEAGVPFEMPDPPTFAERLGDVLEAIYGAYGAAASLDGGDGRGGTLRAEAAFLARSVAQLLPGEPEALGLCALLEHLESRRPAQRSPEGRYVPLDLQDPHRWDGGRLARAEQWLREASALGRPGRFQTEAAIQSAHAERRVTGQVDREGVVRLYEALLAMAPTIGARVGYAGALWSAGRPRAALVVLDELPAVAVASFQAHWAVRAHVLLALARSEEADEAFSRAIGLSEDPAVRRHLMGRRAGADPCRALRPLEEIDTG